MGVVRRSGLSREVGIAGIPDRDELFRLRSYTLMRSLLVAIAIAPGLLAQAPFQAQSASTISYVTKGDEKTVEIHNVAYEVSSEQIPGRPPKERLLLRKTSVEKQVLGDIGEEATSTLEAWPLGTDLKAKPLYALKLTGREGQTVDNALWVASR